MGRDKNMASVKHVIVDSGAFIKDAPLREIGEHIYTIRDVVTEIRDKATRARLQVLPYDLLFREPSAESIRTVTEFSKKTGDYASLSAVDLRLIALTYQLEKQFVGDEHIQTVPRREISFTTTKKTLEKPTEIAGFYLPKKDSTAPSAAPSRCDSVCEASLSQDSSLSK